jgi:ATP-binding cassette, subfamily B (MDR/TAP), member 1
METEIKTERPDSSRALNEVNKEETEIPTHKKAASFWKLQYGLMKRFDVFVIIMGTIGSIGMGLTMPLFSVIFGGTINTFGAASATNPDAFIDDISQLCLKFMYVGLGMWAAGYIMIWLWGYNGRIISKRIKKNYFKLLMDQEQGYFDTKDTYQFATKIQAQVKSIEMGVKIKYIFYHFQK